MKLAAKWILMAASLAACASMATGAGEKMPPAGARQLWSYLTESKPYTQWELWPGHPGMYPGKSPHGAFLKLYANPAAIAAAKQGKPMPDSAILVKENYGEDQKTLVAVTPMYKVKGYNPEDGDWFWVKYGPDGKDMASGKVESCIGCHRMVKDNDYIFTPAKE